VEVDVAVAVAVAVDVDVEVGGGVLVGETTTIETPSVAPNILPPPSVNLQYPEYVPGDFGACNSIEISAQLPTPTFFCILLAS